MIDNKTMELIGSERTKLEQNFSQQVGDKFYQSVLSFTISNPKDHQNEIVKPYAEWLNFVYEDLSHMVNNLRPDKLSDEDIKKIAGDFASKLSAPAGSLEMIIKRVEDNRRIFKDFKNIFAVYKEQLSSFNLFWRRDNQEIVQKESRFTLIETIRKYKNEIDTTFSLYEKSKKSTKDFLNSLNSVANKLEDKLTGEMISNLAIIFLRDEFQDLRKLLVIKSKESLEATLKDIPILYSLESFAYSQRLDNQRNDDYVRLVSDLFSNLTSKFVSVYENNSKIALESLKQLDPSRSIHTNGVRILAEKEKYMSLLLGFVLNSNPSAVKITGINPSFAPYILDRIREKSTKKPFDDFRYDKELDVFLDFLSLFSEYEGFADTDTNRKTIKSLDNFFRIDKNSQDKFYNNILDIAKKDKQTAILLATNADKISSMAPLYGFFKINRDGITDKYFSSIKKLLEIDYELAREYVKYSNYIIERTKHNKSRKVLDYFEDIVNISKLNVELAINSADIFSRLDTDEQKMYWRDIVKKLDKCDESISSEAMKNCGFFCDGNLFEALPFYFNSVLSQNEKSWERAYVISRYFPSFLKKIGNPAFKESIYKKHVIECLKEHGL